MIRGRRYSSSSACFRHPPVAVFFTKNPCLASGLRIRPIGDIERAFLHKLFPQAQIDIRFYDHEYCHAVCASVTAPYKEALVWTLDGWGDKHFSQVYALRDGALELVTKSPREFFPDDLKLFEAFLPSIGGIYSYFTYQLGFVPEEDEGKVEALAAYGKPIPALLNELNGLVSIEPGLSLLIDRSKFAQTFAPERFAELLKAHVERRSLRYRASVLGTCDAHVSAEARRGDRDTEYRHRRRRRSERHQQPEHLRTHLAEPAYNACDGRRRLCAGRGLRISARTKRRCCLAQRNGDALLLDVVYERSGAEGAENKSEITIEDLGERWPEHAAKLVAAGKIGALFHGRMEWGPRALGHRSVIADVRRKDFRDIINRTIKRRPLFQPFCPSIFAREKDRLFESAYLNKHMTCAFRLKKEFWDAVPSAIHIDGTARVQLSRRRTTRTTTACSRR